MSHFAPSDTKTSSGPTRDPYTTAAMRSRSAVRPCSSPYPE